MATPSISIPSTPTREKWKERLMALMAISRTFTGAQLKTIQELITLARAMSLILKEC